MFSVDEIKTVAERGNGNKTMFEIIAANYVMNKIIGVAILGSTHLEISSYELQNARLIVSYVKDYYTAHGYGVTVYGEGTPYEYLQIHWDKNYLQ